MFLLFDFISRKIKFLLFIVNTLTIIVFLATPFVLKLFIDDLQNNGGNHFLYFMILQITMFLISQIVFFFEDYIKGISDIEVWEKTVQRLKGNLTYYAPDNKLTEEEINQHLGQNFELIRDFFVYHPIKVALSAVRIICILVIIFIFSPLIAITLGTTIPIFLLLTNRYSRVITEKNTAAIASMTETKNYLKDIFRQSFANRFRESSLFRSFDEYIGRYKRKKKLAVMQNAIYQNFMAFSFLNFLIMLTILMAGYQVRAGTMSFGTLVALQLYVSHLWSPSDYILRIYTEFYSVREIMKKFKNLLNIEKVDYQHSEINYISLNDVSLKVENGLKIRETINYKIESNGLNLIRGENGSGKTLLIKTLLGLHSNYDGEVGIANHKFNNNFVFVPADIYRSEFYQEPLSLTCSYGEAKLHQLKQAFKENKSVYIFDEPTNFLDEEKRVWVYNQIDSLVKTGKIVIVVSHDKEFLEVVPLNLLEL